MHFHHDHVRAGALARPAERSSANALATNASPTAGEGTRSAPPFKHGELQAYVACIRPTSGATVGYHSMIMNNQEQMQRESKLIATIKEQLPDFVNACAGDEDVVLLHQDACAADYQEDEYALLGKAIFLAKQSSMPVSEGGKFMSSGKTEER